MTLASILPDMKLTGMGQVQVNVQELLALRLKHLFSAADPAPTDAPTEQRCGTATTLCGFTEWLGDTVLPISIGWDWCIDIQPFRNLSEPHQPAAHWHRDDLPRTNIQLLDEHGHALAWDDNLRVLATWVDAQAWQHEVANAVSAAQH